jgi:hypothetical protein
LIAEKKTLESCLSLGIIRDLGEVVGGQGSPAELGGMLDFSVVVIVE